MTDRHPVRTTFVMSYGLSFLSITATATHAILYFWKPIKMQLKRDLREQPDIHAQLMSKYSQGLSVTVGTTVCEEKHDVLLRSVSASMVVRGDFR